MDSTRHPAQTVDKVEIESSTQSSAVNSFSSKGATIVNPTTSAERTTSSPSAPPTTRSPRGLGALDLLVLAAWCGVAAGLLEVGARGLCRAINPVHRLYLMSRQIGRAHV